MFGLLYSRWVWYAVAVVALFGSGWLSGYEHEHKNFVQFKAQVDAVAQAAEIKTKETEARHEADKQEIEQDYKTRLASVQRRYADSLRQSGRGQVPRATDPTRRLNEATTNSDPYLVEQCAETTLQLVELQRWVKSTAR